MSLEPSDPIARQAARRRAWGELAEDADKLANRLIETDGEESVETLHLSSRIRMLNADGFPSKEVSAQKMGVAFIETLRAALGAAAPRRRVIVALALKAEAKAIGDLIVDTQETEARAWRVQHGED